MTANILPLSDNCHMRHAIALGARNLGRTWPNPAVGTVIVQQEQIVGRGWTQPGGRPHAETMALAQAGERARGATAYVSLEPCAHTGKTGPCAQALIDAGITRAVIACRDPDPRVNGQGIALLRAAGINVTEGLRETEAKALNAGFFLRITHQRPLVSLKIATSLDGKITHPPVRSDNAGGDTPPRWLTGPLARAYGHLLRARHDAILTGIGTALADDPLLTCRLPGLEDASLVRVLLDSSLRLPAASQLAQSAAQYPLWQLHTKQGEVNPFISPHVRAETLPSLDIPAVLNWLAQQGITRLLVEGGQGISTSFLQSGMVDRLYWFRAPLVLGEGALDAFAETPCLERFTLAQTRRLGEDMLEIYDIRQE